MGRQIQYSAVLWYGFEAEREKFEFTENLNSIILRGFNAEDYIVLRPLLLDVRT